MATKRANEIHDFKFRFVRNGQPAGIFAKKCHVSERGLQLGDTLLPWEKINDTTTRDDRLLMVVGDGVSLDKDAGASLIDGCALVIHPSGVTAMNLERAIDKRSSVAELAATKARLEAEGRLSEFRSTTCPSCEAQVNLTGFDESKLVFCRFCDCVFQARQKTVVSDHELCTCSECGYFGRVRGYTEAYFYFLLVVYGFSYKRRFLCDGCAGRLFWKVLALNSIFLLGLPSAFWLKIRSMTGRDPALKALAEANTLARKKKPKEASAAYAEVLKGMHDHPGVLLNVAKVNFSDGGDTKAGIRALEKAMESCSNYIPALQLAHGLQKAIEASSPSSSPPSGSSSTPSLGAYGG